MEERARLSSENKGLDMKTKMLEEKVNEAAPLRAEVSNSSLVATLSFTLLRLIAWCLEKLPCVVAKTRLWTNELLGYRV
jgi:hypothetical protein